MVDIFFFVCLVACLLGLVACQFLCFFLVLLFSFFIPFLLCSFFKILLICSLISFASSRRLFFFFFPRQETPLFPRSCSSAAPTWGSRPWSTCSSTARPLPRPPQYPASPRSVKTPRDTGKPRFSWLRWGDKIETNGRLCPCPAFPPVQQSPSVVKPSLDPFSINL